MVLLERYFWWRPVHMGFTTEDAEFACKVRRTLDKLNPRLGEYPIKLIQLQWRLLNSSIICGRAQGIYHMAEVFRVNTFCR